MGSGEGNLRRIIMPAFALEEKLGLSGIGRRYIMPAGETMETLYRKFFDIFVADGNDLPAKHSLAQHYAGIFVDLNRDMNDTRPSPADYDRTLDFIRGMVSGYNKDDIDFYLYIPADTRKEIGDRQVAFLKDAGIEGLNWMPCPRTFESIKAQLAALHGADWFRGGKVSYNGMDQHGGDSGMFVQIAFE